MGNFVENLDLGKHVLPPEVSCGRKYKLIDDYEKQNCNCD